MPGAGRPMWPDFTSPALAHTAKGAVSVMPRPVSMRMRSPQVASARRSSLSHTGCESPAPAKKNMLTRANSESRSLASLSIALAISSKPLGTLKYTVGEISRRLRSVSWISAGVGLPSSM